MMAKPMKTLEMHHPMTLLLIILFTTFEWDVSSTERRDWVLWQPSGIELILDLSRICQCENYSRQCNITGQTHLFKTDAIKRQFLLRMITRPVVKHIYMYLLRIRKMVNWNTILKLLVESFSFWYILVKLTKYIFLLVFGDKYRRNSEVS